MIIPVPKELKKYRKKVVDGLAIPDTLKINIEKYVSGPVPPRCTGDILPKNVGYGLDFLDEKYKNVVQFSMKNVSESGEAEVYYWTTVNPPTKIPEGYCSPCIVENLTVENSIKKINELLTEYKNYKSEEIAPKEEKII